MPNTRVRKNPLDAIPLLTPFWCMASIDDIVVRMRDSPQDIRFSELEKVCNHFFGEPRRRATSHSVYKTPWPGDPRVNIQKDKGGKAKAYQVKQVLQAVDKKREMESD
jgi:hypothetical protein